MNANPLFTLQEIDWAIEIPDLLSVQQLVTPEGFHAVKLEWGSPRSPLIGHGISEYHIRWRRLATIGVAPQVECIVSPGIDFSTLNCSMA